MNSFRGRLALQQRILPSYRVPFFDLLAASCAGGLSLFAGQPRPDEGIISGKLRVAHHAPSQNLHLFSGGLYMCYQHGLISWLEGWDPDALILEANPRYLASPSAVRWMHRRSRPVLGWGLGSPSGSGPLAGLHRTRWLSFLRRFDGLIAYSRRGAAEYEALGYPKDRIFVAFNSVSPAPAAPPPQRPNTPDRPVLLYVGRLQPRKRIDLLLRACAALDARPRLLIVGDGPERHRLEELAAAVYPEAEFAGTRQGNELEPFYAAADLFVLPGTGGLAVQQAMAHALPVVVAQGDGTQDDLVRPGNGWQVIPGSLDSLVGVLRDALGDIPRLRSMGSESYRIVADEINLQKMVASFVFALNGSPLRASRPA
jgi:glycosyltransferase involved in cell wall biosynthesis